MKPIAIDERTFSARADDFDCRMQIPMDWIEEPRPLRTIDFTNPRELAPLAVLVDPNRATRFGINARPGYGHGMLSDWAHYLMDSSSFTVHSLVAQDIGSIKGVAGTATDATSYDKFLTRFAFLEDGDRVVQLLMATSSTDRDTHLAVWTTALGSFALTASRGSNVEVFPPVIDWWGQAKQLEVNNQLDEAEAVIKHAIPHLAFALQTATLYAERYARMLELHNHQGAVEAHEKAVDWIRSYAGFATSGGEGAALSYDRDVFLAALGPSPQL
ncbi:MAG: hypothetical protein ABI852_11270 [Gemmatimonadaceae bacterium]